MALTRPFAATLAAARTLAVGLALAAPLAAPSGASAEGFAPSLADRRADRDDARARNLVVGLAALAAIGLVLRERDDEEDGRDGDDRDRVDWDREDWNRGNRDRRTRDSTLPARCLGLWPVRDGMVEMYDPACLDRRFEASDRLPLGCVATVRSEGRFVSGYSRACLREEGWDVPRD